MRSGTPLIEADMESTVFTSSPTQSEALRLSLARTDFLVVGLCAAWCNTCTEFRGPFESLPGRHKDTTFVWVDIEDDASIAGEIDVENFPTLAIFHRDRLVHFGTSLPQASLVSRILQSLHDGLPSLVVEKGAADLPIRLRQIGLARLNDDLLPAP